MLLLLLRHYASAAGHTQEETTHTTPPRTSCCTLSSCNCNKAPSKDIQAHRGKQTHLEVLCLFSCHNCWQRARKRHHRNDETCFHAVAVSTQAHTSRAHVGFDTGAGSNQGKECEAALEPALTEGPAAGGTSSDNAAVAHRLIHCRAMCTEQPAAYIPSPGHTWQRNICRGFIWCSRVLAGYY